MAANESEGKRDCFQINELSDLEKGKATWHQQEICQMKQWKGLKNSSGRKSNTEHGIRRMQV